MKEIEPDLSWRTRMRAVINQPPPRPVSSLAGTMQSALVFVILVTGAVVVLTALAGGFR
jgi:hypothetical protein